MNHNASAIIAIDPRFHNTSVYQKTFGLNTWYASNEEDGKPLGNVQLLGRVTPEILKIQAPLLPTPLARWISSHAIDLYALSEDLPDPESRVVLNGDAPQILWRRSNMRAHHKLVAKVKKTFRAAGFPLILSRLFDERTLSHQCGTARLGLHPRDSVLDPNCRAWEHSNLFVTDASALPTSAAVNPALTIATLALRAAKTIEQEIT